MITNPRQAQRIPKKRPRFVMPPAQRRVRSQAGSLYFNGVYVAGNVGLAGRDQKAEYLQAIADVYSIWRNQYILGQASATEAPFVLSDNTAIVRRRKRAWSGASEQLQRIPVDLPAALADYRRIILLGKPGAGKSTYLQYLALRQTQPDALLGLLPVLVELNSYQGDQPFLEFIRERLRNPPNQDLPEQPLYVGSLWLADNLEYMLQKGSVLLLIDGLNEMAQGTAAIRTARVQQLQLFFRTRTYERVRAIVTCRSLDYDNSLDAVGFQTVLLDPWSVEQMVTYLQQRGDKLLLDLLNKGDELLLSLGQCPFLLYMLTELTANYAPPPDGPETPPFLSSESAIFRNFIDLLLDWASAKDPENGYLFARQIVIEALARLAAAMEARGCYGTSVPFNWASDQLPLDLFGGTPPPRLDSNPQNRLLEFACQATILDTSRPRNTLRFWHLVHQDYFAGLALRRIAGRQPAPGSPNPPPGPSAEDTARLPPLPDARGRVAAPGAGEKSRVARLPFSGISGEAVSLAAAMAPDPDPLIAQILEEDDPRAALRAARALLSAGAE